MTFKRLLLAAALSTTLVSCAAPLDVRALDFQAAPAGTPLQAAQLLHDQHVSADRLVSIPEAIRRAPDGSLLVVCNDVLNLSNLWGVCSHVSRKLADGVLTDSPNLLAGGVQNRPANVFDKRYAVIVLDVGVTPELLPRLRAEAERLKGTPYMISGTGSTLDCTTYQNALQSTLGLPDIATRNAFWNLWLPQDALTGPAMQAGGKVLWVGVRGQ